MINSHGTQQPVGKEGWEGESSLGSKGDGYSEAPTGPGLLSFLEAAWPLKSTAVLYETLHLTPTPCLNLPEEWKRAGLGTTPTFAHTGSAGNPRALPPAQPGTSGQRVNHSPSPASDILCELHSSPQNPISQHHCEPRCPRWQPLGTHGFSEMENSSSPSHSWCCQCSAAECGQGRPDPGHLHPQELFCCWR